MNRTRILPALVLVSVGALASACGGSTPIPEPSASATSTGTPSATSSGTPSGSPSGSPTTGSRAVYYVGDTPLGPRLYREFHRITCQGQGCLDRAAIAAAVGRTAEDPDYTTAWPAGTRVRSVSLAGGTITVDLHGDLHDRPAALSEQRAGMAIQQVLYTAQAAFEKGPLPVQLLLDGRHTDTLLGVPTAEALASGSVLATLSHVNLFAPLEGAVVRGDTMVVAGLANSFEANVVLRLQRFEGTGIVFQGPVTAGGWQADRLFPFHTRIDVSKVPAGKYVLMAMTDDPSGRGRFFTDTKVVQIR